jgi:hypothetical protein
MLASLAVAGSDSAVMAAGIEVLAEKRLLVEVLFEK